MNLKKDWSHIFVTGAPGWLGDNLLQALVKGLPGDPYFAQPFRCEDLMALGLEKPKVALSGVKYTVADVRDDRALTQFFNGGDGGLLIHIAGVIHPKSPKEFYQINHVGTLNVLNAAANAGIRRAVVMSSNSPFGTNESSTKPFDEDSPYNPYMGYGKSKMFMEKDVAKLSGKLETVLVRAPWFYGPHQPDRQVTFFKMIRDGKVPIVGSGENLRSMSYMDNLVQGLLLASSHLGASNKAFWIADESPYTMNEIVKTISDLLQNEFGMNCKNKVMRLPNLAGSIATFIDSTFQKIGLYHQKVHVLSEMNRNIFCSVKRAKTEIGYKPQIGLREGMRRSIQSAIDNRQL